MSWMSDDDDNVHRRGNENCNWKKYERSYGEVSDQEVRI